MRNRATHAELLRDFELRKPRALAQAISAAESGHGGDLVRALFAQTGHAMTIGLTGPPGVGKSTLASALVRAGFSNVFCFPLDFGQEWLAGALYLPI